MKYYAEFKEGQYAGRHWFATKKERAAFLKRAADRGYTEATLGATNEQA